MIYPDLAVYVSEYLNVDPRASGSQKRKIIKKNSIGEYVRSVTVESTDVSSSGDYYCMVQNIYGKLYSIKASLRVSFVYFYLLKD